MAPDGELAGTVLRLGERRPQLGSGVYIAPMALVAGDVVLGDDVNVWPGAVLRGDHGTIRVGARTNIQDGTVVHSTHARPTLIGADVVVGHGARLEGCTVEDAALIGMGSVVLHGVTVGSGAVVGAGAVLAPGTQVPPGALALGVPARIREATAEQAAEREAVHRLTSAHYVETARRWRTAAARDGG